ncbi:hypothetical protein [Flavobacterium sp. ZS1P14]|uniref:hypothetical protein n=1 Tax=Flavobacterium sp. ZS1P14 TaxID=3401729 RepID=UPI003AAC154F
MENQNQNIGKWEAWTYPSDLVPHIYVTGIIPTNGVKPIFTLSVDDSESTNETELVLQLNPDEIDTAGKETSPVAEFWTPSNKKTVLIRTKSIKHVATVPVIAKEREEILNPHEATEKKST